MSTIVIGFALILLIAAVSVAVAAAARVALGLLLPALPPDDDPRWVRNAGTASRAPSPRMPAPRTPGEAFEQGSAAITRTLLPDATVPIARLASDPELPTPLDRDDPSDARGHGDAPASTTHGHSDPVGRAVDRIAVRF
jgi:hypothetical protein